MQTYYFDIQDGIPVRDRKGIELASGAAAVAHSKRLAASMREKNPSGCNDLNVIVTDESGREIHREAVYPAAT